jgi:hypothetical protein
MADQVTPEVKDLFGDEFAAPAAPVAEPQGSPNQVQDSDGDGEPVSGVTEQPQTTELVQEIDLGDGGGKQVFKAKSPEEMIAKLTKAQENATRKIREQQFELQRAKRATPDKTTPTRALKQLTADDKFALAQEFAKDPESALEKLLAAKGLSTTDLNQIVTERSIAQAEQTFLSKHEGVDFLPSPSNAKAMQEFLTKESLPYTAANLEYAFQELSEGGLLDMPSSSNTSSEGEKPNEEERIVVPEHTRRKPMSTGLTSKQASSRQQQEQPTASGLTESEVEQLYRMDSEEGRKFILRKMREAEQSSGSRK